MPVGETVMLRKSAFTAKMQNCFSINYEAQVYINSRLHFRDDSKPVPMYGSHADGLKT